MSDSKSMAGPSSQQSSTEELSQVSRLADSPEFQLDPEEIDAVMEATELELYEDNVQAATSDE